MTAAELNIIIRMKDEATKKLKGFRSTLKANAAEMRDVGRKFAIAGLAITAALGGAVKAYGDFDQSMKKATAVSDVTEEQFSQMSKMAEQMSMKLGVSANTTAEAFYFLGSAGLKATQQIAAFPAVAVLAKAAVMGMGQTAEMVVDTMKGFKIGFEETGRVTDVLAKAVTSSNMTFGQLGQAMTYVSGIARTVNMSLEETTAVIGMMANVGIKGSMAGTSLRRALLNLAAPASDASKTLKNLGVEVYGVDGKMKPLTEIMEKLIPVLKKSGEETRNMALKSLFGARAVTGMVEIVYQGADGLKKFTEELKNSGGAAREIADEQLDTLNEQFGILVKHITNAGRDLGKVFTPAIRDTIGKVRELLKKFSDLDPAIVKGIATIALFIGLGGIAGGGLIGIAAAAAVVGGPIVAIIAGISGLIVVVGLLAGESVMWLETMKQIDGAESKLIKKDLELSKTLLDNSKYWSKNAEELAKVGTSQEKATEMVHLYAVAITRAAQESPIFHNREIKFLKEQRDKWKEVREEVKKYNQLKKTEGKIIHDSAIQQLRMEMELMVHQGKTREEVLKTIKDKYGLTANYIIESWGSLYKGMFKIEDIYLLASRDNHRDWAKTKQETEYAMGQLSLVQNLQISKQKADEAFKILQNANSQERNEALKHYIELQNIYLGFTEEKEKIIEGMFEKEDPKMEASKTRWQTYWEDLSTYWQDWGQTLGDYMGGLMQTLEGGFTTLFTDVLEGQKSFADTMKSILNSIKGFFINMVSEMLSKWIMSKIAERLWAAGNAVKEVSAQTAIAIAKSYAAYAGIPGVGLAMGAAAAAAQTAAIAASTAPFIAGSAKEGAVIGGTEPVNVRAHPNEAFLPLDKLPDLIPKITMPTPAYAGVTINFYGDLKTEADEETFFPKLTEFLKNQMRGA